MRLTLKLILIIFLFLAIFKMPYWYYQLLRFICTIGFLHIAYTEYQLRLNITTIIYSLAVIAFNPIIKISFSSNIWKIIDIAFIIILVVDIFFRKRFLRERTNILFTKKEKIELIKILARNRIIRDFDISLNTQNYLLKNLPLTSETNLLCTPEASMITIMEKIWPLNKKNLTDQEIIDILMKKKKSFSRNEYFPTPTNIIEFIKYYIDAKHIGIGQIQESYIEQAVEVIAESIINKENV